MTTLTGEQKNDQNSVGASKLWQERTIIVPEQRSGLMVVAGVILLLAAVAAAFWAANDLTSYQSNSAADYVVLFLVPGRRCRLTHRLRSQQNLSTANVVSGGRARSPASSSSSWLRPIRSRTELLASAKKRLNEIDIEGKTTE